MPFVELDFSYYHRTIAKMVQAYYTKRMVLLGLPILILSVASYFYPAQLWLNLLVIAILLGLLVFHFLEWRKFPTYLEERQQALQAHFEVSKIEESEFAYTVITPHQEPVVIAKQNARNLPSDNKELTFLVGFTKGWFSKEPLQLYYYDLLELTYEEKYRLKRNGYSNMPRFLRRFSWSNIKNSSGNALGWILGNLFTLYLLWRILSYLWRFLQGLS